MLATVFDTASIGGTAPMVDARRVTSPGAPGRVLMAMPMVDAGVWVDERSALNYSAVFACVTVIAESIASMPWHVYQWDTLKTKRRRDDSRLEFLLDGQPNPSQTPGEWREQMLAAALLWPAAYAEIERSLSGEPIALWPIEPERVTPMVQRDGSVAYRVTNLGGDPATIPARNMFTLHGPGTDGIQGLSIIGLARQAIGLGIATEQFGGKFFGNGAHLSGVLETDAVLSDEQFGQLSKRWREEYSGSRNSHKTPILEGGLKYRGITVNPNDAQFLETRQFQVTEICRWFKVPPHILFELSRATWSNVEQMRLEFVQRCLIPWVRRLEQEANRKLVSPSRSGWVVTALDLNSELRGDAASRAAFYASGRQWGWVNVNEIRQKEGFDPIGEEGDVFLQPANMVPAGQPAEPPAEPPPAVDPPPAPPQNAAWSILHPIVASTARRVARREVARLGDIEAKAKGAEDKADRLGRFAAEHREYWVEAWAPVRESLTAAGVPVRAQLDTLAATWIGRSDLPLAESDRANEMVMMVADAFGVGGAT